MLPAQFQGPPPHLTLETLIANERRIASRALKALARFSGPGKKIAFVDKRPWRHRNGSLGRKRVLLNTYRIAVSREELAISTRRIEKPIRVLTKRPCRERLCNIARRKIGPRLLLAEYRRLIPHHNVTLA
jgi:hypothetical protein